MVGNAVQHSVAYALLRRTCPPVLCGRYLSGSTFAHLSCICREPLASVGATAQNHIFYTLQQLPGNIVINPEHLGIDYAHIHPGQPCVIKKCRMHSLAHRIVAAKGKGKVRNPARNLCVREILFDPAGSLYEIKRIAVVLFDSRGNCQNIWIENDIFCGETAFNQKVVGAPRNCNLTFETCGLPLFVKQHHNCRNAVRTYQSGPPQELFGTLLERDGVHNGLALAALQPRHYGVQRRRIYHKRHPGDVYLASRHIQKSAHSRRTVYQPVVHTYVNNLPAGGHLSAGHGNGSGIVALAYHTGKLGASGHVAPLAYIDKVGLRHYPEGLQAADHRFPGRIRQAARRERIHQGPQRLDKIWGGAAAAAHNIHQTALCIGLHSGGKTLWSFVVAARDVGQAGVGMHAYIAVGHRRQPFQMRQHLPCSERAVDAHAKRTAVLDRGPEGLYGLPGEGPARLLRHGDRYH